MRKRLLPVLSLSLVLAAVLSVGCNSGPSENSQSNTPVPPAQPSASLMAVNGSCKPTAEDFAAGTVKLIKGPATGQFTGCQVMPPNKQNMVAFQARNLPGVPGTPALLAIAPAQAGSAECVVAKPVGVNFNPNQADNASVILVTKGDTDSGCKIESTIYDAHHWKGKLTASLLPSQMDKEKAKPVPVEAEWDLYY